MYIHLMYMYLTELYNTESKTTDSKRYRQTSNARYFNIPLSDAD